MDFQKSLSLSLNYHVFSKVTIAVITTVKVIVCGDICQWCWYWHKIWQNVLYNDVGTTADMTLSSIVCLIDLWSLIAYCRPRIAKHPCYCYGWAISLLLVVNLTCWFFFRRNRVLLMLWNLVQQNSSLKSEISNFMGVTHHLTLWGDMKTIDGRDIYQTLTMV